MSVQGHSRVVATEAGPTLAVSVGITNQTTKAASLTVNLHCPILIRLYSAADGVAEQTPAYDGLLSNCSRAARVLELVSGREEQISVEIPLTELRRDRTVPPGAYLVEAIVLANSVDEPGPFAVSAGRVELP